jgi:hypothetical protein
MRRFGAALLVAAALGPFSAAAQQSCSYIAEQKAVKATADRQFEVFEKTQDCSMIPALMEAVRRHNALTDQIVRNCPGAKVQRANAEPATLEAALRAQCKAGTAAGAPNCTSYARKWERHCEPGTSMTVQAVNNCNRALQVKICLGRADMKQPDCDAWEPVKGNGGTHSYWTCSPNGQVSVQWR